MVLREKNVFVAHPGRTQDLISYLGDSVMERLSSSQTPIRFVITKTDEKGFHCELGIMDEPDHSRYIDRNVIFRIEKRVFENTDEFNAVLLVPTGIGAEIGGHAGDAGPVARLLSSVCDNLVTHPNVVNASDINELPDNGLYVEGSVITRLLMGTIGLQKVRANRVILVVDKHEDSFFHDAAVNAVSGARAALGLDCPIVVMMDDKVIMQSLYSTAGRAIGKVQHLGRLCELLDKYEDQYDAVALSSVIKVPKSFHRDYYDSDMVNPWGGVEAMLTHAISLLYNVPSAHSPMVESREILDIDLGQVDPRKAAEVVSVTFLHSILKGLHKSPRIVDLVDAEGAQGLFTVQDVSCLVIPDGCIGLPTLAAIDQGIPIIEVKENTNRMQNNLGNLNIPHGLYYPVDNYLEAAGVMSALKAGVSPQSIRRPLGQTQVSEYKKANPSETAKRGSKRASNELTKDQGKFQSNLK